MIEPQNIVIGSKHLLLTDDFSDEAKPVAAAPTKKKYANFLDEIFAEFMRGRDSENQVASVMPAVTINKDYGVIGATPTMDSGKYKPVEDVTSFSDWSLLSDPQQPKITTPPTTTTPVTNKTNWKHYLIIAVVIVFAIIFLKGLFK